MYSMDTKRLDDCNNILSRVSENGKSVVIYVGSCLLSEKYYCRDYKEGQPVGNVESCFLSNDSSKNKSGSNRK